MSIVLLSIVWIFSDLFIGVQWNIMDIDHIFAIAVLIGSPRHTVLRILLLIVGPLLLAVLVRRRIQWRWTHLLVVRWQWLIIVLLNLLLVLCGVWVNWLLWVKWLILTLLLAISHWVNRGQVLLSLVWLALVSWVSWGLIITHLRLHKTVILALHLLILAYIKRLTTNNLLLIFLLLTLLS